MRVSFDGRVARATSAGIDFAMAIAQAGDAGATLTAAGHRAIAVGCGVTREAEVSAVAELPAASPGRGLEIGHALAVDGGQGAR